MWGIGLVVSFQTPFPTVLFCFCLHDANGKGVDNVFCGDSLFHPSLGTARCDFPGGSAQALWHSARKLLSLPDHVKIWTGHDYAVEGEREPEPWTSVGEHRTRNKH